MSEKKKAKLKKILTQAIGLIIEIYPDAKKALKKDITPGKMASDIMSTLDGLNPEVMKGLKDMKISYAKRLRDAAKRLKI